MSVVLALWKGAWLLVEACLSNNSYWFGGYLPRARHIAYVEVKVSVAQLCPTLCNPMDSSLLVSFVHEILWERILESRWLPFASPGDLPNPGLEPWSPAWQIDSLLFELPGSSFLSHILSHLI